MAENKFTAALAKTKADRPKLELKDFLEDGKPAELVEKAKTEGRFLQLPPECFTPDPDQPRKSIDPEKLAILQHSIEEVGQIQPIAVRPIGADGKYEILTGERRWRAVSQSQKVKTLDAVIIDGEGSALWALVRQIEENDKREDVNALEKAAALRKIVDMCKERGEDQAAAAEMLSMSVGQLSKYMTLLRAPEEVAELSRSGEVQDVEVLYRLTTLADDDHAGVVQTIEQWRAGELGANLRETTKKMVTEKKEKKSPKAPAPPSVAHAADVRQQDGKFFLAVMLGKKEQLFELHADAVLGLKSSVLSHWGKAGGAEG